MRPSPTSVFAVATVVVGLAGLVWIGMDYRSAGKPLAERLDEIRGYVNDARLEQRRHDTLLEDLQTLADRTLGGDRETVDHELRRHLNRIGESVGLAGLSVNTSRYAPKPTPARSVFSARAEKAVRDEIDFVEVEGTVSGEGTLEQVMRLVHQVHAEPWPKRIDQLRLNPTDNGAVFDVKVRLTTLFLSDRPPASIPGPGPTAGGFEPYAALADINPFRVPPPPAPVEPPTPAPPVEVATPTPPAFPWGDWVLTGVVEGPGGGEIWLLNSSNRETRRMLVGERFEELELQLTSGDAARFTDGQKVFLVRVGGSLDDRLAIP